MKLGYVLLYVEDVVASVEFYERAFNLKRGFVHESQTYAEMVTGGTKLGFVANSLAAQSVAFQPITPKSPAPGIEVGFVAEDVDLAFDHAVKVGAVPVLKPVQKPWGQWVSYVRDGNGFLVEICSAME